MQQAEDQSQKPPSPTRKANEETVVLSRRNFFKAAGVATVAAGMGATTSCDSTPAPDVAAPAPVNTPLPPVAAPPPDAIQPGQLRFFNWQEAQMVEAMTARILPGTPEDPGAREAGVVYYIDNLLAYQNGFVAPTYHKPPFAQTYSGETPPAAATQQNGFQAIWVPAAEIERYGYQSSLKPSEAFRLGVAATMRYSRERFNKDFTELSEEEQDAIITALEQGEATGFDPLSPKAFFLVLRRYTGEGMFSDPAYGGNRNLVGWKLIGYPGAQRAYLPAEIGVEGSGLERPIWSMADLPHFHAGLPGHEKAILPVSGSDQRYHHEDR